MRRVVGSVSMLGRSPFASSTALIFPQTAAPLGWTKSTTHNDKCLRVVSGAAGSGGATAFSSVFGAGKTTGGHTLATGEIPSHVHATTVYTVSAAMTAFGRGDTTQGNVSVDTGAAGGGGAHSHTLSLDLQYVDVIIATKD